MNELSIAKDEYMELKVTEEPKEWRHDEKAIHIHISIKDDYESYHHVGISIEQAKKLRDWLDKTILKNEV